jgi:hypothetical protein
MEPNQALFRRLVRLYLLLTAIAILAAVYESAAPRWRDFSGEFDLLVQRHFGSVSAALGIALAAVVLLCLAFHVVAAFALLRFKRWARLGFWASFVAMLPALCVPGLGFPFYSGPMTWLAQGAGSMLFGAILLLAYTEDLGASWFTTSASAH